MKLERRLLNEQGGPGHRGPALPRADVPVLPLDGVHIVMSLLERLRGRAFSQLAYMRYSAVGLTLFAFLLYLGLRNDFTGGPS